MLQVVDKILQLTGRTDLVPEIRNEVVGRDSQAVLRLREGSRMAGLASLATVLMMHFAKPFVGTTNGCRTAT